MWYYKFSSNFRLAIINNKLTIVVSYIPNLTGISWTYNYASWLPIHSGAGDISAIHVQILIRREFIDIPVLPTHSCWAILSWTDNYASWLPLRALIFPQRTDTNILTWRPISSLPRWINVYWTNVYKQYLALPGEILLQYMEIIDVICVTFYW